MGEPIRKLVMVVVVALLLTSGVKSTALAASPQTFTDFNGSVNEAFCENESAETCQATVNSSDLQITDAKVTKKGKPKYDPGPDMYFGTSRLVNNSEKTQNLSSQEFSKQVTETITTTVTNGFKAGVSETINASFLGIGSSTTLSAEYNYSSAEAKTSTDTVTYTAKSQNIEVPPHTTALVKVYLKKVKAKGKVNLNATIGGPLSVHYKSSNIEGDFNGITYEYFKWANHLPKEYKLKSKAEKLRFKGTGQYKAELGTDFDVRVKFKKQESDEDSKADKQSKSEKQSQSGNGNGDKPYNYTVPAK
ncbi:toxin ETX/toxin MTX2 [Marininema mesophilum]|uniref:Toxin ETX/toxin MTX2 n=1 Tax=Marininema mesophilum TaxID=1048340 RepID=A0A1H2SPI5_9BACL|nr:ETX/MTX2 family pore-forming toxin [Marininema mesophilum]SDW33437.1 toxin ETX/toxin MTX2 [Marininema mesophilum]